MTWNKLTIEKYGAQPATNMVNISGLLYQLAQQKHFQHLGSIIITDITVLKENENSLHNGL